MIGYLFHKRFGAKYTGQSMLTFWRWSVYFITMSCKENKKKTKMEVIVDINNNNDVIDIR